MAELGWEHLEPIEIDGVCVHIFRSNASGMRVMKVDSDGPMVNLYGVLSTEAVTNDWSHAHDGL
eukprot:CAMPEP_0119488912 /NCGR_PEP_ID=MMETSP1344-20130328/14535_1 /TAXON_ID=236787 /ORGANISM="Florenciella parvula, Strain CCMP2471" /LENGTH=63 /DNA_ID=CAMNT_0007523905 /DNA_START=68 /DNA_END=256 /DNA_ORIENTATION=-